MTDRIFLEFDYVKRDFVLSENQKEIFSVRPPIAEIKDGSYAFSFFNTTPWKRIAELKIKPIFLRGRKNLIVYQTDHDLYLIDEKWKKRRCFFFNSEDRSLGKGFTISEHTVDSPDLNDYLVIVVNEDIEVKRIVKIDLRTNIIVDTLIHLDSERSRSFNIIVSRDGNNILLHQDGLITHLDRDLKLIRRFSVEDQLYFLDILPDNRHLLLSSMDTGVFFGVKQKVKIVDLNDENITDQLEIPTNKKLNRLDQIVVHRNSFSIKFFSKTSVIGQVWCQIIDHKIVKSEKDPLIDCSYNIHRINFEKIDDVDPRFSVLKNYVLTDYLFINTMIRLYREEYLSKDVVIHIFKLHFELSLVQSYRLFEYFNDSNRNIESKRQLYKDVENIIFDLS